VPESTLLQLEIDALRSQNEELSARLRRAEHPLAAELREAQAALALDRSHAEEGLRRNEALFRALVEKSSEAISLTSADGATRHLTPSAWNLLGWRAEELGAQSLSDRVVPEDRERVAAEWECLARTGARAMSTEFRVNHRDGSLRWIEATGTNLLQDADVSAIVLNYRDITARKLAEDALSENRDLLQEAQAIAQVGSWASGIGADAGIEWSRECYRIFGIAEGTPITVESFLSYVHPDDRASVIQASRNAIEMGAPYDIEHRVQCVDGRTVWVHERALVQRDANGQPIRLLGAVQDVTDRHVVFDALEASEERYRRIVENTSEGVWMYDAAGITTFMNGRMASLLGYTVEEAVGQSIYRFVPEANRPDARARVERRQLGIAERLNTILLRKDETQLWTSIQTNPLFDADGRFEGGVALVTDLSAERSADEARARLAAMVESSEDAILTADLAGVITSWNRSAEALYQYSAPEVIGQSLFVLVSPAMLAAQQQMFESAARGEAIDTFETQRRRKDGSSVEVALTVSPVRDGSGKVIGVSKIARDLTVQRKTEAALRRTEEQFRQAQKMEAIGRLAGGVAHDFNNLLSVILSYSSFALEQLRPGDPLRSDVEQVEIAGKRATELTRQLLAFSRQQVLQPRVLDLNHIIVGMKGMLGRLLGEDIELTTLSATGLGRIHADPGQLEQVVMNLAVNARDAMPEGGKLTIETVNVALDAGYVGAHLGVTPGDYVMLAVSDTGIGMDAPTRARIFEPFFTTKEKGKGTGLGLSTVFGIVEQSGGHVDVYSEPGRGCTFKVYLPRTDRVALADEAARPSVALNGTETILLVEDELQVRTAACAILRRKGYNVLETSNGGEAFLLSCEFGAAIHLLLTDVIMPRMSGRRLSEQLALRRPEMKVLFVSGYTDDAIVHHGVLEAGVAFLQKPFTPESLLRKVRDVLDAA